MKTALIIVSVLALLGLLLCTGLPLVVAEVPFTLAVGWASYLVEVLPTVHVNRLQAYFAFLGLFALLLTAHTFAQWLWRELRATASALTPSPGTPGEGWGEGLPGEPNHATSPPWRIRWTLTLTTLILLTFNAGIAFTGVAHQCAWLARSEARLVVYRFSRQAELDRRRCDSNLRSIGRALELHAKDHAGRLPDTLEELLTTLDMGSLSLICPASNEYHSLANAPTTAETITRARQGHATYVYLARGQHHPTPTTRPLVCEPLTNHDLAGLHILYSDGTVQFHTPAEAQRILSIAGGQ